MNAEWHIVIRRESDRIAIETWVSDADYQGLANTSYLDADAALRLFGGGMALAREAKQETRDV